MAFSPSDNNPVTSTAVSEQGALRGTPTGDHACSSGRKTSGRAGLADHRRPRVRHASLPDIPLCHRPSTCPAGGSERGSLVPGQQDTTDQLDGDPTLPHEVVVECLQLVILTLCLAVVRA